MSSSGFGSGLSRFHHSSQPSQHQYHSLHHHNTSQITHTQQQHQQQTQQQSFSQKGDVDGKVKVVVRPKPLSDTSTQNTISIDEKSNSVDVFQVQGFGISSSSSSSNNSLISGNNSTKRLPLKSYVFDHVFSQSATQAEVFNCTVQPLIEDVLRGYSCTCFTYGQSGSGKTHTMEGDIDDMELMGVIPRAACAILDALDPNGENSVKVSFLELYNEELQDLLASGPISGHNSQISSSMDEPKLRIMDDKSKDLGRGLPCQNLEEIMVKSKNDVLKLIRIAQSKRKAAATDINKNSSRSHCIFTMVVHMRETTLDGEDLLKVGKLNLVDLAGSECIGRSGATDTRAREAGNINQSLLTLGRVITALCERSPHIPYRDSKLTRLLQESLGGKAKTVIIATIAPNLACLEETISTLDYASRAKNIKNKPTKNSKVNKRVLLTEFQEEMERIRRELAAARAKDGVYLPEEEYEEMKNQIQTSQIQIDEAKAKVEAYEKETEELKRKLMNEEKRRKDSEMIINAYMATEISLHEKAKGYLSVIDENEIDINQLRGKIERKIQIESKNKDSLTQLISKTDASFQHLSTQSDLFMERFHEAYALLTGCMNSLNNQEMQSLAEVSKLQKELIHFISTKSNSLAKTSESNRIEVEEKIKKIEKNTHDAIEKQHDITSEMRYDLESAIEKLSNSIKSQDGKRKVLVSIVQDELSNIRASLMKFSTSQQELLMSLRNDMNDVIVRNTSSYSKEIEQYQKNLHDDMTLAEAQANRLMEEFSIKMKELFQSGIKQQLQKRSDDVQHKMSEINAKTSKNVDNVMKSVDEMKENIEIYVNNHKKNHDKASNSMLSQDAECKNESDTIIVNSNELWQTMSSNIDKLDQLENDVKTTLSKETREASSVSGLYGDDMTAQIRLIETETQKRGLIITSTIDQTCSDINSNLHEMDENHKQSNEVFTEFQKEVKNTVEIGIQKTVMKYATEDYKFDVATGSTPSKRNHIVDRMLPKTLPHEKIIEQASSGASTLKSQPFVVKHEPAVANITVSVSPSGSSVNTNSYRDIQEMEEEDDSALEQSNQENNATNANIQQRSNTSLNNTMNKSIFNEVGDRDTAATKETDVESVESEPKLKKPVATTATTRSSIPSDLRSRLEEMTVVEMKNELGIRGLSKIGTKNVLISRLENAIIAASSSSSSSDPSEDQQASHKLLRRLSTSSTSSISTQTAQMSISNSTGISSVRSIKPPGSRLPASTSQ